MSPREQVDKQEETLERVPSDSSLTLIRKSKAVTFGVVSVRVFERIVGDHPDVSFGPPIAIGWAYNELESQPIDEYEKTLPTKRGPMRLSSVTRRNLLKNVFDVDEKEILHAESNVAMAKRLRELTLNQGKASAIVETALQSARRKIRRALTGEAFLKGLSGASGVMIPFGMNP